MTSDIAREYQEYADIAYLYITALHTNPNAARLIEDGAKVHNMQIITGRLPDGTPHAVLVPCPTAHITDSFDKDMDVYMLHCIVSEHIHHDLALAFASDDEDDADIVFDEMIFAAEHDPLYCLDLYWVMHALYSDAVYSDDPKKDIIKPYFEEIRTYFNSLDLKGGT